MMGLMNGRCVRIWKNVVKVYIRYLPGEVEENHA
jgi:hypothetical protein